MALHDYRKRAGECPGEAACGEGAPGHAISGPKNRLKKTIAALGGGASGRWRERETGSRVRIGVRFGDCRKDFQTLRRCVMFSATIQYVLMIAEWFGELVENSLGL